MAKASRQSQVLHLSLVLLLSALTVLGPVLLSKTLRSSILGTIAPRQDNQNKIQPFDMVQGSMAQPQGQEYKLSNLGNISLLDIVEFQRLSTKSSFDPFNHPVFTKRSKLKVLFLSEKLTSASGKHLFLDDLRKSDYLELVAKVDLTLRSSYSIHWGEDVWIYDLKVKDCASPRLVYYLEKAFQQRQTQQQRQQNDILLVHVDYYDIPYLKGCSKLLPHMGGDQNVRFARRSIVQGRTFNSRKEWVDLGHFAENAHNILHSPYPVRTDQVNKIRHHVLEQNISSPIDFGPKLWDVAHFWSKSNDSMARLRDRVADICLDLTKTITLNSGARLRAWCNLAGKGGNTGRQSIQGQYVLQLLRTRIVIVVQRDCWEDHYRLMEALASGALVLADFMLSLPKGLAHGESIVLFRSEQELRDAVVYYANHEEERRRIAQKGWEVAMGRHRSWHRLEELLFGQPLTDVDNAFGAYQSRGKQ